MLDLSSFFSINYFMEILNGTPLKTLKHLTTLQVDMLEQVGINTLGQLICISPRKIEEILPWSENIIPNIKYHQIFEIGNIVNKKSSRGLSYTLLELRYDHKLYQGFLFSRANFILNKLRVGQKCLMTVSLFGDNGSAWSKNLVVQKIKFIDEAVLDLDGIKSSYELFYPKISSKIDSQFLRRVFGRLNEKDYEIDLSQLVPFQLFKSNKLNLNGLHHPVDLDHFYKSQNQLQILKVFLKTALQKYVVYQTTKTHLALSPELDLGWMQESVKKLPVVLTSSQKLAIWDILQDITITHNK